MLSESAFLGEGDRQVKLGHAAKGIRVDKNRVLRLMRWHGLLAPVRRGHPAETGATAAERALGHGRTSSSGTS